MRIEKKAIDKANGYRDMKFFPNARTAFLNLLAAYRKEGEFTLFCLCILAFHPMREVAFMTRYVSWQFLMCFIGLEKQLEVDVKCLEKQLQNVSGRKVLLLVHYWGYVNPAYQSIIRLLRKYEVFIVEDCAHALYTHLIDSNCGEGDCTFYSFHKMLPFDEGGFPLLGWRVAGGNRFVLKI